MASTKTTHNASKKVSFSQFSNMVIIPNSGREAPERWYSHLDCNRFRQATLNDARRMSRLLATTPREMITQDELQECLGIETYLDRDMLIRHQERRNRHSTRVLIGQHLCNANELSVISQTISQPSRVGARSRAQS